MHGQEGLFAPQQTPHATAGMPNGVKRALRSDSVMTTRTKAKRVRAPPKRTISPHLHFYMYTVSGLVGRRRLSFRIVCCHAADARAMIVQRCPKIDALSVRRGESVHYIAIGDHLLHE
jgi:hypothetical protein